MRINQYLASCGICSRRKAEELIKNNLIKVNGVVNNVLSTDIKVGIDKVEYKGKLVKPEEKKVYLMLNKPKGYLTSVSDDRGRPTVLKLIKDVNERIFPVGRLDYNTEGLLILTNDGEFANSITHPSKHISKTYEVLLKQKPMVDKLQELRNGIEIDGEKTLPAYISKPRCVDGLYLLEVTIFEGKNRQVRKMFEAIGYKVFSLKRIAVGKLTLQNLPLKAYKHLTEDDIKLIFK